MIFNEDIFYPKRLKIQGHGIVCKSPFAKEKLFENVDFGVNGGPTENDWALETRLNDSVLARGVIEDVNYPIRGNQRMSAHRPVARMDLRSALSWWAPTPRLRSWTVHVQPSEGDGLPLFLWSWLWLRASFRFPN